MKPGEMKLSGMKLGEALSARDPFPAEHRTHISGTAANLR